MFLKKKESVLFSRLKMKETDKEVLNISIIVQQTTTSSNVCVVCGDVAQYSYYGAIVCQSCKIFFRRHVPIQSVS
jgi:hypothetical protein